MKIKLPHYTTRQKAKQKVEKLLQRMQKQHGHMISDLDQHWEGDVLVFGFKTKGMSTKGELEITDDEVKLAGSLPLLAKPFESKIKKAIEIEADSLFKKA